MSLSPCERCDQGGNKLSSEHATRIKILNKEIGDYFKAVKVRNVRRSAMGEKANLWKALQIVKNLNPNNVPAKYCIPTMTTFPQYDRVRFKKGW